MPSRVRTIASHEYLSNVRRKEFIFVTLGLPLFILVLIFVSAAGTASVFTQMIGRGPETVGVLDRSRALDLHAAEGRGDELVIVPYADLSDGQRDVRNGRISELVVVDRDYLENGKVELFRREGGLFSRPQAIPVGHILARALLARTSADPKIVDRAVSPVEGPAPVYSWNAKTHRFAVQTGVGEAARFLVPYLFSILLMTSIFMSASYLLRGIADEKENRVIEVILSSVSPEELLKGKLIGLAGVGLTQVGLWLLIAGVPGALMFARVSHVSFSTLGLVVLFFALGFGFFATLMAGIGALGTSYRETQQLSAFISMLAIPPLLLLTVLVEFPNGTLARVLSFIPFTAPTTMVLRMTSADVPTVDIVASALIILAAIWLTLKLSARLFRFGLLIYGKRPSFRETIRWLAQS